MEIDKIRTTLCWLHEKYQENPNSVSNIAQVQNAVEYIDIAEIQSLGSLLVKKGFVKQHTLHTQGFNCSITTLGINQVSSVFSEVRFKILEASIEQKKYSLTEILGIEPAHFRKVQDLASYLKKLGIIECIFHSNDVYAEPTFYGREWYQAQKLKLIS